MRGIILDILGQIAEEKATKSFFDWANLLTKQMHYVEEIRVDLQASEQLSKMLFTHLKTTPGMHLIEETAPKLIR